jgi:hypothetical protein
MGHPLAAHVPLNEQHGLGISAAKFSHQAAVIGL